MLEGEEFLTDKGVEPHDNLRASGYSHPRGVRWPGIAERLANFDNSKARPQVSLLRRNRLAIWRPSVGNVRSRETRAQRWANYLLWCLRLTAGRLAWRPPLWR